MHQPTAFEPGSPGFLALALGPPLTAGCDWPTIPLSPVDRAGNIYDRLEQITSNDDGSPTAEADQREGP
jgi:hypothetical protein